MELYRICQETINNIIKHSNATFIRMQLKKYQKEFILSFEHDGKGISDSEVSRLLSEGKGNGLKNLISRIQLINAQQTLIHETNFYINSIAIPINHDKNKSSNNG